MIAVVMATTAVTATTAVMATTAVTATTAITAITVITVIVVITTTILVDMLTAQIVFLVIRAPAMSQGTDIIGLPLLRSRNQVMSTLVLVSVPIPTSPRQ
nr:MAG: hypothetical protein [Apis mellifera filamentous virus]